MDATALGNLLLIVIGIVLIVFFSNRRKQKREAEEANKRLEEEKRKKEIEKRKKEIEEREKEILTNGLPVVNTQLRLSKGEICHFGGPAAFCKFKQQTVGYEGGNRGVSLRITKGVSYRVGNYQGHYVKDEVIEKTKGVIYLTDKKIIFNSLQKSYIIKNTDIINLNAFDDFLQILTGERSYLFEINNAFEFVTILGFLMNENEE